MGLPEAPALRGLEKFPQPSQETITVYRGTVINPLGPKDHQFFADGGVAVTPQGTIMQIGDIDDILGDDHEYDVVDETRNGERPVITPAFTDVHVHWVQNEVRGRFGGELLPWLQQYIWPEEAKYGNPAFASERARRFFADTAKAGTVIAAVYSSIHEAALRAAFEEAVGRMVIGNVMMTDQCPDELRQDRGEATRLTRRLAGEFGSSYAVTPRFAVNCDQDVLRDGSIIAESRRTWGMTHLAESPGEDEPVRRLHPDAADYTDAYEQGGFLKPYIIMAHAIHLSDREINRLAVLNVPIAHCPTSNEALESGRMPLERLRAQNIRYALGSDVGAGPSLSMLHVMRTYVRTHAERLVIPPTEALYRATLAGARMLNVSLRAGNLAPGKEANFVMMRAPGTANGNGAPRTADALLAELLAGSQEDLEGHVQSTFLAGREIYRKAA